MSQIVTIDAVAREYKRAVSPDYKKVIDRGDTVLGITEITPSTQLTGTGESHMLKSYGKAGSGRRGSISIKDIIRENDIRDEWTVAISLYGPAVHPQNGVRQAEIAQGLFNALTANSCALLKELVVGVIDIA